MRLNIYLQRAGVGSRREAERMVADGRVRINGVVATPTMPVEETDAILLDGKLISIDKAAAPRLFMLNKPLDVLVTAKDSQNRTTVYDLPALQAKHLPRLMYVGRLDVNSEGLLLLSSDGQLAQHMMNPEAELPRVYRVRVFGKLTARDIALIRRGVTVDRIRYRPAEIEQEQDKGGRTNTWYRVTLYEGKNREIRKLMEHFGCVVNRLIRIQYGPFHLEGLESGKLKEVPTPRVQGLMDMLNRERAAKSSVEPKPIPHKSRT
jgi:23S rRNA pseudouridine2605 synthase